MNSKSNNKFIIISSVVACLILLIVAIVELAKYQYRLECKKNKPSCGKNSPCRSPCTCQNKNKYGVGQCQ